MTNSHAAWKARQIAELAIGNAARHRVPALELPQPELPVYRPSPHHVDELEHIEIARYWWRAAVLGFALWVVFVFAVTL